MAGSNPGFDPEVFRAGIRVPMEMGLPQPGEAPVFHFPNVRSTLGPADQSGLPFDPDDNVDYVPEKPPVSPLCAVEFVDNTGQAARGLDLIQPTRVRITLLDEEYALVEGCERVVIDGDTYWYRRTEPPVGMFEVTVYLMHFHVDSET